jgi:ankyrin repeat protein
LNVASIAGDLDVVKAVLGKGADVNAKDHDGSTPLIYAAELGHLDLLKVLLANGADVNARRNDGSTALKVLSDPKEYRPSNSEQVA